MQWNIEELMSALAPMFARVEPRLQAAKYVRAVLSDLPKRNGWTIAEWVGDRSPDATQRLLNRASWDTAGAMSAIRRFAVARLNDVARPGSLSVGALDESGQEKKGTATAGVKRQHMGCAGGIDNGINTVHLAYVRAGAGHALIASRQWIPAEQITDPVKAITTGLPLELTFRTKGELAIDLLTDAWSDGVRLNYVAGDEVYGACTQLRTFVEENGQAYVLRVRSSFAHAWRRHLPDLCPGGGQTPEAQTHVDHPLGRRRFQGRAHLRLGVDRHRQPHALPAGPQAPHDGELAFHYCFVPEGQPVTLSRLVAAAGLRWPIEEMFEFGKDLFGLDQSQVRLYGAILRHTVLVMAALAICAASAAAARCRTDTQAPPPTSPDQRPPEDPGMVPLTIAEIKRLLNATATHTLSLEHTAHWSAWRHRHQARARWFHRRARLATAYTQLS